MMPAQMQPALNCLCYFSFDVVPFTRAISSAAGCRSYCSVGTSQSTVHLETSCDSRLLHPAPRCMLVLKSIPKIMIAGQAQL